MVRKRRLDIPFLTLVTILSCCAFAQTPVQPKPEAAMPLATRAAQATPAFDVNAAVEAYFAKMPPARRAASNAYFEGGYWMQLWDFLSTVFVMWLLTTPAGGLVLPLPCGGRPNIRNRHLLRRWPGRCSIRIDSRLTAPRAIPKAVAGS